MDCSIAKRALGTSQGGGERGGKMDVKRKKEKTERKTKEMMGVKWR